MKIGIFLEFDLCIVMHPCLKILSLRTLEHIKMGVQSSPLPFGKFFKHCIFDWILVIEIEEEMDFISFHTLFSVYFYFKDNSSKKVGEKNLQYMKNEEENGKYTWRKKVEAMNFTYNTAVSKQTHEKFMTSFMCVTLGTCRVPSYFSTFEDQYRENVRE